MRFLPLISANLLGQWLSHLLSQKPVVKWPNDLLIHGKKFAGILCEAQWQADHDRCTAVVGIGINVEHAPQVPNGEYTTACLNNWLLKKSTVEDLVLSFVQHWERQELNVEQTIPIYESFHLARGQLWQHKENSKQLFINEGISQDGHLRVRNLNNGERQELVSAQHALQWAYQARFGVRKAPMTILLSDNAQSWTLAHYASADDSVPQWLISKQSLESVRLGLGSVWQFIQDAGFVVKFWPIYIFGKPSINSRACLEEGAEMFLLRFFSNTVSSYEEARQTVLKGA